MNERLEYLKNKATEFPELPGIYMFLDSLNKILYIGKAKNLKNRIKSYFNIGYDNRRQIPALIETTYNLRFLTTSDEREALILENNLIKENKPYFNISLKDDKNFKSIKITLTEEYPKISIVRSFDPKDKNIYFGPYCDALEFNVAYKQILNLFQIRDCSDLEFKRKCKIKKPCMKYFVKQCLAPCADYVTKTDYKKSVDMLIDFLKGKNNYIINELKTKMKMHSDILEFEKAEECYKKIQALTNITNSQSTVSGFTSDADVIGFYMENDSIIFQILIIRFGKILSSDYKFFKEKIGTINELLREFILQYYIDPLFIPNEIWINTEPEDITFLEEILSIRKTGHCKILIPLKGRKFDTLKMANSNAKLQFQTMRQSQIQIDDFAKLIQKELNLLKPIYHIECFDISHNFGKDMVGVKISYQNGRFIKNNYRRFHIKTTNKSDDYQCLYEILTRRVKRGLIENDFPDLFLIDGGLGQLSVLERVLKENKMIFAGAAISKESHSKSSIDTIYVLGRKNFIPLKRDNPVLLKFMEIRDETHRFAKKFYAKKNEKRIFK